MMTTAADPVVLADDALSRGDNLEAYDIAISAEAEGQQRPRLAYIATLALARMGDTNMALDYYDKAGLGDIDDDDILALLGRLKKDLAETAKARDQAELFAEASRAYREVYENRESYFTGINAATTALLAGDRVSAEELAEKILDDPAVAKPTGFYATATAAEANILLGRGEDALDAISAAVRWSDASVGSKASTFRQMMLIAKIVPDMAEIIAPIIEVLRPSPVLVFTGHMFRADLKAEEALTAQIDAALDELEPDTAYGALACGADILVAEAVIRRGLELHVVLPFEREDFITQSVRPGGEDWVPRFEKCMERATSVSFATDMSYIGDPNMFSYGSAVAMGLARMRARHLRTSAVQLAIAQTEDNALPVGTNSDVSTWNSLGHESRIIDPSEIDRNLDRPPEISMPEGVTRVAHSMIFADFAGFSKLSEAALPLFARDIFGRAGKVLDEYGDKILYRNSWGDALYAVVSTPKDAAEIVLKLQTQFAEIPDLLQECAGGNCGMRIGVHHGPIYRGHDAVMMRTTFFGTEVTRTARIEPVTPTGEVYATEAFAAILSLESDRPFGTHYVGRVQLAKNYGTLAMYKLSRRNLDL
ncbi:adenylate/guanylate cyclase domain-containing protein [Parasphingopyxis sp. CP4]|uniref:adenylate/guanylate cyclase domain-containing protein n=1 Tax=Parasphingopyxis sp. CP4 TaxID=2724527 RepID=UPI0015A06651|nr:adenylate/guanylate cyclase domain-containing protein [Parasphingopyxis sp. CP4]QLC21566.1 adenylate/guanylate cyclase domain-containing protein [Parasphingopyxis sp. CP4]